MDETTATTIEQTTQTATEQLDKTQPQAVTVDMEAINKAAEARAERAAQTVVKDMLTKQGLDDETIKDVLKEWKTKQITPDQTIQDLSSKLSVKDAEILKLKQEKILRGYGLTDDEDIEVYSIRIDRMVTTDKTFDIAAKEYFEAHPRPTKTPATATYGGTGKTQIKPMESTEKEQALKAARAAMKIK